MGGFETGRQKEVPAPEDGASPASARNARLGLLLFALYVGFYAGYVFLSAFHAPVMETAPFAGVNLAILYGLGLIAVAFILALIYAWLCRAAARRRPPGGGPP
jgi:uncharacterized membrane protein (DUF485 family)